LGLRVRGLRFGFRLCELGFGIDGLGFGVWLLGFGVQGFAFRVLGFITRYKPYQVRCRPNQAHMRQSRPDSGLGFKVQARETFQGVPSSLDSEDLMTSVFDCRSLSLFCAPPPPSLSPCPALSLSQLAEPIEGCWAQRARCRSPREKIMMVDAAVLLQVSPSSVSLALSLSFSLSIYMYIYPSLSLSLSLSRPFALSISYQRVEGNLIL